MSTHTLPWTFEEIGRGENKSLEVEFECCVSPCDPGSYWEPSSPAEVEFCDVTIVEFLNTDSEVVVGPSWLKFLRDIAFKLAEQERGRIEEQLSENIGDYEEAALDDYYERKRDELRGC